MKKHLALSIILSTISGLVAAEPAKTLLVPDSQNRDFGIICRINDKTTYYIKKDSNNNDYQIARNIYFTDISSGRVAISLMHGFVSANKSSTYITATNESCNTFSQ